MIPRSRVLRQESLDPVSTCGTRSRDRLDHADDTPAHGDARTQAARVDPGGEAPANRTADQAARHEIGSIEVGKRADLVLHDRDRPEWTPLHDVVSQLVWSADGRSVDTVFVDGRKVVEGGHVTTIDEERLFVEAQRAGSALVSRSGLPKRSRWPVVGQLPARPQRQRLEFEDA